MRKIKIVKFEELEVQDNRNIITFPKDLGQSRAFSDDFDFELNGTHFKTEDYFINHYIDDKSGRIDFAITKEQEKIFKSFIMSKYDLYGIGERYYSTLRELTATKRLLRKEIQDNCLLMIELKKYKNMKFWDRFKFLFSGKEMYEELEEPKEKPVVNVTRLRLEKQFREENREKYYLYSIISATTEKNNNLEYVTINYETTEDEKIVTDDFIFIKSDKVE